MQGVALLSGGLDSGVAAAVFCAEPANELRAALFCDYGQRAAAAEARDIAVAPHCPLGPIALASSLQLDFCTPNALIQETSLRIHYHDQSGADLYDYVQPDDFFTWEGGHFLLSDRPGLGIEINEEAVAEAAAQLSIIGTSTRWPLPVPPWRSRA